MARSSVIPVKLTTADAHALIRQAVEAKYGSRSLSHYSEWILLWELRTGSGYGDRDQKRVDLVCLNAWPSKDWLRVAYEVKISRSDWLRELKDPTKRQAAEALGHQCYVLTTPDIVRPDELPVGWGLQEAVAPGKLKTIVKAPQRKPPPLRDSLFVSIARRWQLLSEQCRIQQRDVRAVTLERDRLLADRRRAEAMAVEGVVYTERRSKRLDGGYRLSHSLSE